VLFNEPKLLKYANYAEEEIERNQVSVLFNEPKLLKSYATSNDGGETIVSVLFNEPKLLKSLAWRAVATLRAAFQCSSTSRNC